jgi:hypothetical protein
MSQPTRGLKRDPPGKLIVIRFSYRAQILLLRAMNSCHSPESVSLMK